MGSPKVRASDYRLARIGAAAALVLVLGTVLIIDAASTEYQVDPLVITVLLGTIGTLLGIEGLATLRQAPPTSTVRQETFEDTPENREDS